MFTCFQCQESFSEHKAFLQHVSLLHELESRYRCGLKSWPRIFTSFDSLRKHIRSKHADNEYPNKAELNKHMKKMKIPIAGPSSQQEPPFFDDCTNPLPDASLAEDSDHDSNSEISYEADTSAISIDKTDEPATNKKIKIDTHMEFAAKLYSYADVSRTRSHSIINDTAELFKSVTDKVKDEVVRALNSSDITKENLAKIETLFKEAQDPFLNIRSEWRCMKNFHEYGTYVAPQEYLIGEREEFVTNNDVQIAKLIPVRAQFIPIRHVFTQFFGNSRILDETLDYVNALNSNNSIISNFIQGTLWRNISTQFEEKIVFPLFLYFDDFENNNPLGSHKGISKCGAAYLSIPCLPPHLVSKVNNIFLFILFNTLDRKVFTNDIIFSKVLDELNYLESNGIQVSHNSKNISIYFKLVLVVGDNLGLHSILGFVESFNTSFFCRFCYTNKKDINTVFDECDCLHRTEESYLADVMKDNKKLTGVVESCIFHAISDFHVAKNFSIDVMHDVLEGICQYDLGLILHSFITVNKYFTLNELNHRIKAFNYGSNENKPPEILMNHLKQKRLMMSASEMRCLIRHLPLIIGTAVPIGNDIWDLLIQLREIVEIVMSSYFHPNIVFSSQTISKH